MEIVKQTLHWLARVETAPFGHFRGHCLRGDTTASVEAVMPTLTAFAGDELGHPSADRAILVSGVLLLVAMLVHEFLGAGTDMLLATVEPGVQASGSETDMVTVANSIDR